MVVGFSLRICALLKCSLYLSSIFTLLAAHRAFERFSFGSSRNTRVFYVSRLTGIESKTLVNRCYTCIFLRFSWRAKWTPYSVLSSVPLPQSGHTYLYVCGPPACAPFFRCLSKDFFVYKSITTCVPQTNGSL